MKWEKVNVFRVTRREDGHIMPVTETTLDPSDLELLKKYMGAERIKTDALAHNDTDHYLFMYNSDETRPYSGVLIWKFIPKPTHNTFVDMTQADRKAAELAIERYLR